MVNIFCQYWQSANEAVKEAINKNLSLEGVKVFMFVEQKANLDWLYLDRPNLTILHLDSRATYGDFLTKISDMCNKKICIFINSDIIVPQSTIDKLPDIKETVAFAISRRELDGSLPSSSEGTKPDNCQDVWVLKSHTINEELLKVCGNIQVGRPGCDNRFAAELVIDGYSVYNPCNNLVFIHNSKEAPMSYPESDNPERYNGLYAYLSPCSTYDVGKIDYKQFLRYYPKVRGRW